MTQNAKRTNEREPLSSNVIRQGSRIVAIDDKDKEAAKRAKTTMVALPDEVEELLPLEHHGKLLFRSQTRRERRASLRAARRELTRLRKAALARGEDVPVRARSPLSGPTGNARTRPVRVTLSPAAQRAMLRAAG